MAETASADAVVAIRYHNLICALKTATPTLAVTYAAKSDALMAGMGMDAYCHPARALDPERLLEQFRALEKHAPSCAAPSPSATPPPHGGWSTSSPP